jgi:hypothetical protein
VVAVVVLVVVVVTVGAVVDGVVVTMVLVVVRAIPARGQRSQEERARGNTNAPSIAQSFITCPLFGLWITPLVLPPLGESAEVPALGGGAVRPCRCRSAPVTSRAMPRLPWLLLLAFVLCSRPAAPADQPQEQLPTQYTTTVQGTVADLTGRWLVVGYVGLQG